MKAACRWLELGFSRHGRMEAALLMLTGVACCMGLASASGDGGGERHHPIKHAERLFSHWSEVAHAMPRGKTVRDALQRSDHELMELAHGEANMERVDLFRWHASNRSFTVSSQYDDDGYRQRAQLYNLFLELVFSDPKYSSELSNDFAFYFEANDGFRAGSNTDKLPLPVLVNARTPTSDLADPYSLPAPDHYMAFSYYHWKSSVESRTPLDPRAGIWTNNHPNDWKTFAYNLTVTPWEDKIDDVVFRAWSWGSMNPFEHTGPHDLAANLGTRSDVCVMAEEMNISAKICCTNFMGHYCRPSMSMEEMMEHRYQLNIDGQTCSWDAAIWKYQSGSVVLYVHPTNTRTGHWLKPWDLWWTPAMVPYQHYIPTTVDNLLSTLVAIKHLPDGGESIAVAAREQIMHAVNFESAAHYTFLLVKHVHDAASEP